jgi:hypothetical protein
MIALTTLRDDMSIFFTLNASIIITVYTKWRASYTIIILWVIVLFTVTEF